MTHNKANKSKISALILGLTMCLALMLGIVFASPTSIVYAAGETEIDTLGVAFRKVVVGDTLDADFYCLMPVCGLKSILFHRPLPHFLLTCFKQCFHRLSAALKSARKVFPVFPDFRICISCVGLGLLFRLSARLSGRFRHLRHSQDRRAVRDKRNAFIARRHGAFRLFGAHSASFAPFDRFHLAGDFARRVFGRERIIAYRVFLIIETRFIRKSVIPLRNREKFVVAVREFSFYLVYRADVVTRPCRSFRGVFARDASVFYRYGL